MDDDFTGWNRVGRGRSFRFYAMDGEVAGWLVETLPAEFAPYVVFRELWEHPRLAVYERPIDDIARSFAEDRAARHWIKSAVLTPHLQQEDISVPSDLGKLSFNALILIRLGADRHGRRETQPWGWSTESATTKPDTSGDNRSTSGSSSDYAARCASASSSRRRTGR